MRPLSGGVLALAALLTSPALWAGIVDGTMPLDVTLTRFLVACGVCWVVLSVVADLIWPAPALAVADEVVAEPADAGGDSLT